MPRCRGGGRASCLRGSDCFSTFVFYVFVQVCVCVRAFMFVFHASSETFFFNSTKSAHTRIQRTVSSFFFFDIICRDITFLRRVAERRRGKRTLTLLVVCDAWRSFFLNFSATISSCFCLKPLASSNLSAVETHTCVPGRFIIC